MFVRIFLVLLSVAALTRAADAQGNGQSLETDCERHTPQMCTREFMPVCGSNGETYANKCWFCSDKLQGQPDITIVKLGNC